MLVTKECSSITSRRFLKPGQESPSLMAEFHFCTEDFGQKWLDQNEFFVVI